MNDKSHTYTSKSYQNGKGRIPPQADIKKEGTREERLS